MRAGSFIAFCLVALVASEHYFNSQAYFSKTAKEKLDLLNQEINKDHTPQDYFSSFKIAGMLVQDNKPTMEWVGDVLPEGRDKLIHTNGVVAPCIVEFDVDSGYTGLLQSVNKHSLIRLSAAASFDTSETKASGAYNNFTPGFGLKILVDGQFSKNLVAMYDTSKQDSWDFFEHNFTNNFDIDENTPFAKRLVARSFSSVTNYISAVGLREWALFYPDGSSIKYEDGKFPFRLIFVPGEAVKNIFKKTYTTDFKNILATIPSGTVIYDIYAVDKPGCKEKKIGNIKITAHFVTSKFADIQLFFRHLLIDLDDQYPGHVGFEAFRDSYTFFGRNEKSNPRGKYCPFSGR